VVALLLERYAGLPVVFLLLAAVALTICVYFVWSSLTSVETASAMDFDDAMSFALPTVAEEQKLAILRALKDLEFERAVGKISEPDYQAVLADYRARAKASIQLADESLEVGRKQVEEWVELARSEREVSGSADKSEASS